MRATLRVYYLPNYDGTRRAMVAAPNQREACRLIGVSVYTFRLYGGHAVDDEGLGRIALSAAGRVWHQKIDYGPDGQPWLLASYQRADDS
jgi:hypothetical protein